ASSSWSLPAQPPWHHLLLVAMPESEPQRTFQSVAGPEPGSVGTGKSPQPVLLLPTRSGTSQGQCCSAVCSSTCSAGTRLLRRALPFCPLDPCLGLLRRVRCGRPSRH